MKNIFKFLLLTFIASFILVSCNTKKSTSKIEDYNDTVSYALGVDYAAQAIEGMIRTGESYNLDLFVDGFSDFVNNKSQINPNDAIGILRSHLEKLKAERRRQNNMEADLEAMTLQKPTNEDNMSYLEENAKKDGVKQTASGLQYRIIKEGKGAKPKATDVVRVHYSGTLTNGQLFDGTKLHGGNPAEFPLNQVISGWTEGIQLMPVGSIYEFTIPPYLGYGNQDIPGLIPANSILIFEVELLEIVK